MSSGSQLLKRILLYALCYLLLGLAILLLDWGTLSTGEDIWPLVLDAYIKFGGAAIGVFGIIFVAQRIDLARADQEFTKTRSRAERFRDAIELLASDNEVKWEAAYGEIENILREGDEHSLAIANALRKHIHLRHPILARSSAFMKDGELSEYRAAGDALDRGDYAVRLWRAAKAADLVKHGKTLTNEERKNDAAEFKRLADEWCSPQWCEVETRNGTYLVEKLTALITTIWGSDESLDKSDWVVRIIDHGE